MSDNPNSGYYQSGIGSLTGFDQLNLPTGNPKLATVGMSLEELRRFLLNQSGVNFPSNEWLLDIEQRILDHLADFNNPHRTTLDQIVGSFTPQVLGNIAAGTVPDTIPFFSYDALLGIPLGDIFPATYTANNLYRQTPGGWLTDIALEDHVIGTDYVTNRPGLPLFSAMTNITPITWATDTETRLNTTLSEDSDETINYPFDFYGVRETPVSGVFGVDIPMTQDLQVTYTTTFFIRPSSVGGKVRIFQPGDSTNYFEVNLDTGVATFFTDTMIGATVRNIDGIIRVSASFTSLLPTADNRLRVVHINEGASGDGTRVGSNGRHIFSIAHPQTTLVTLNQPVMVDLEQPSSTSLFVPTLSKLNVPATISNIIITMKLNLHPQIPLTTVVDPTIMTFGNLVITRDQTTVRVSLGGSPLFTSDLLDGLNSFTISYSPTKIIFKDLALDRQVVTGTYAPLETSGVSFGPFGGYLCSCAFYAQADDQKVVEYLNNG